ncbi:ABC-2 family transporter permease [Sporosarcina cascadiensis]|uniref:hypothetical protein n=1 Tax=Sporosarcina cascadiensis TaxID=2660747 RepID=UPI00129AF823|nr:hypothetical protein [Sporosarcina cascadiensis]
MYNTLKLEAVKTKRTSVSKLWIAIVLFAVIVSAVLAPGFLVQNSLNWWYTLLYPLVTALICSTIFGKLDKDQNFQTLFLSRTYVGKFFTAKCMIAAGYLLLASVLYCLLLLALTWVFPSEFDSLSIISAVFVTWLGYLFLIPLCGMFMLYFPSLLVTVCIVVATEAMQIFYNQFTIWQINPFITPAILMTTIINTLPNGLLNNGVLIPIPIQPMLVSLLISIVYLFVMIGMGRSLLQRKADR